MSVLPDLRQPGQAWERISGLDVHVFDGLNVPLIYIHGTKKSWFLENARLREWTNEFPQASSLNETVRLPDGSVIGGPSANHLRFFKRDDQASFERLPAADDLYWTDHVEGSNIIFAKKSSDGALLVFDGEGFVPSPVPEKGHTRQGEFLPWYSTALGGYFTAYAADIWFYRTSDPSWRPVKESETHSWAPSWGLYERGSRDTLSPDGSLLKVISENRIGLTQYRVSDGNPIEILPLLRGQWHQVGDSGEIVGWLGAWHRILLAAQDHEESEAHTPKFTSIPPNSDVPQTFPDLRPLILIHDENSISYQYRFATMPGTDRLYFLHGNGFAYYSGGEVSPLPAEWLDTVGKLPHFLTSETALYVIASNGLFRFGQDDTLTKVWTPQSKVGFGPNNYVFDLECEGNSIGFLGRKTGIYSLDPNGEATLIAQSHSAIQVYGVMPDKKSILFAESNGQLKLLSAEC
ncbi:hypothetical protein KMP13_03650 [Epibacterium ulvae]|uniref:hypothetical protein n=1 Tax=Epibacterium ulvae TaxID=1156985 RepID=UPI001BFC4215|nr:hypothetical protein [Epibacterium ulvae]MBT8152997.1 hypothetical protein [Epibacterium ulvae]